MKLLRTGLFAFLAIGTLTVLTYLIYFTQGSMERRAARALGRYLVERPRVRGASHRWMGPLSIREIEVPASPVIDRRHLLLLSGVEVEAGGREARIARAELALDHELVADPAGRGGSRLVWNFRDVFRGGEGLMEAARSGGQATVERLRVDVQAVRRRQEKVSWAITVEDLVLQGMPDGAVEARGELAPGTHFSEGQFQVRILPRVGPAGPPCEGRASFDDLQGLDELLSAVFPAHARAQALLSATGPVTLTVSEIHYSDRSLECRALARHYDSLLRLAPWSLEVRHASGAVALEPGAVELGPAGEGSGPAVGLSGEIWGTPVELSGRIAPGASEVRIRLGETDLEAAAVSAQPRRLAALWRLLRPRGTLAGSLELRFGDGPLRSWALEAILREVALEALPFLGAVSARVDLRGEGDRAEGQLEVTGGRLGSLGEVRGAIPVSFAGGDLTLKPADLSVGGGSLYGKLTRSAGAGGLSGSLLLERGTLHYAEGLLSAARVAGKMDLSKEQAVLKLDLEAPSIRTELLPAEAHPPGGALGEGGALVFKEGELRASLAPGGARSLSLVLRGERCGVRLKGLIGRRGDLDGVAVLAVGDPAQALNLLGTGTPAEWRRAVEEKALPLRVRGDAQRCLLRRVSWADPSFSE